jgi:uncharacterized protein YneF (UPF0154 family)
MGKIITNLVIILGFITIAFAGYYIFIQQGESALDYNSNEQTMQNMLNNTQVFISRRQALDRVDLNSAVAIFDDAQFRSLRSFATPVQERPVGRENPFATPVVPNNFNNTF